MNEGIVRIMEGYATPYLDPRPGHNKRHKLLDIIVISLCTLLCGGESWKDMELFGEVRYEWLKEFLELPNGRPCASTFYRVISRICPKGMRFCYQW